MTFLLGLTGCEPPDPSILQKQPQNTPSPTSKLTLNKATLEQANSQGQNLWKLQVQEAVYSPDRKNAQLSKLKGDLYENGKVVLKVSADRGSLEDDGATIVLRDNIVALDPRNKAVLRSQEVQWRPKDSFLFSPQPLKGSHSELEVTAQQGRYDTKKQELTLFGKIDGLSPKKQLTVKAEQILWEIPKGKISSDQKMTFSRYQGKEITDQAITQKAELYLKKKQVLIKDNIEFKSLKPSLQVAAKELDWRYEDRTVESKQPLQVLDYVNLITVTGNQGKVDFKQNMAWLTGGTKSKSDRQQSQLFADQLTWNMKAQTLEAFGNIIYEQQKEPKFNLTGDRAVGSLVKNNVVVTSDRPERVVTEIYPSPK